MAHPIVEKLQDFGIRHGEKVGVGVVSTLTVFLLWTALSQPSIDLTPEQISQTTQRARQNLNKPQKEEDIVNKIRNEGIVQPEFIKIVENRKEGSVDAGKYQFANLPAAPEPGAGLLREAPELITVAKLEAHPGRGAMKLFVYDEQTGNFKMEPIPVEEEKTKTKRSTSGSDRMRSMMGSMGQQGGMAGGPGADSKQAKDAEAKRKKAEQERLRKGIAGDAKSAPAEEKAEEPPPDDLPPGYRWVESMRGFRWVVVTGVVDNRRLRDNFARALKTDPNATYVHYLRVDMQRRYRQDDGTWSDWEMVDRNYSLREVIDARAWIEEEQTADGIPIVDPKVKVDEICDPLPFLEAGYWVGVHHGDLVNPKIFEQEDTSKSATGGNAMFGNRGMMGGGQTGPAGGMEGMMLGGRGGGGRGMMGGMGSMMAGGMASGGGMGQYGAMFGSGNSSDSGIEFTRADADRLMLRTIDFTAEPDTTYEYRVRLVARNPNYRAENVMPGVDNESKELVGPWSDIVGPVTVPPDAQAYVLGPSTPEIRERKPDAMRFEVVRWKAEDGYTVVQTFDAGVGEIVGEPASASLPVEDGDKTIVRSRSVDFTSGRVLVDALASSIATDRLNLGTPSFNLPASVVLLRPDGRIEVRDEAGDQVTGEVTEMRSIYRRTLEDARKGEKKGSTALGGMGGMGMGGMGMMGVGD